jgi:hypothetical protein
MNATPRPSAALIGSPVAAGLFPLLKALKGGRIKAATTIEHKDGRRLVPVTIEGDNNSVIVAHPQALELLREKGVVDCAKRVVQPLTKEGYDHLEFERHGRVVEQLTSEVASLF